MSTADVRTEIAVATAQAYLAIIAQKRQVEVSHARSRDGAGAPRLCAGGAWKPEPARGSTSCAQDRKSPPTKRGSRVRSSAVRIAQEALGV